MFEACVWSNDKDLEKKISDGMADSGVDMLEKIMPAINKVSDYKISEVLMKFLNTKTELGPKVTSAAKVRVGFGDNSPESVKAMLQAAEHAKNNPISTEQNVFITSKKIDNKVKVQVTGFTPHVMLTKTVAVDTFFDKTQSPQNNMAQVNAGNVRTFINVSSDVANCDFALKYVDMLIDPGTNTGLCVMGLIGRVTPDETEYSSDGDATKDVIITGFGAAKFNMEKNTLPDLMSEMELVTEVNRGLKNKIRMATKHSNDTNLTVESETDVMSQTSYKINIWNKDVSGDILRTTVSTFKESDIKDIKMLLKYKDRDVVLNSSMLKTALDNTKGDLKLGLSENKVCLIAEDAIVCAAVKNIDPVPPMEEQIPISDESENKDELIIEKKPAEENAASKNAASKKPEENIKEAEPISTENVSESQGTTDVSSTDDVPASDPELHTEICVTSGEETPNEGESDAAAIEDALSDGAAPEDSTESIDPIEVAAGVVAAQEADKASDTAENKQSAVASSDVKGLNKLGLGKIYEENGNKIIEVINAETVGDFHECRILDEKIIVRLPVKQFEIAGRQVIAVRAGTMRHRILETMIENKGKALDLHAIIELGGDRFKTIKPSSVLSALSQLYRDGLITKPTRGLFQFCESARFQVE